MKHLLLEAAGEIERLRRQNEILGAKVETMNLFATVLHSHPAGEGALMGMQECVVSKIRREYDRLEREEKTAKPKPEQPAPGDVRMIRDVPLREGDWAVECSNPGHFLKVHPSEFGMPATNPAYSYFRPWDKHEGANTAAQ